MILTDVEYAAKMAIPDLTEKLEDSNILRGHCEDCFSGDEYLGHLAWKRALDHADMLNEEFYEDNIGFCVVKFCQDYYVLDKEIARVKFGIDFRPRPI